MGHRCWATPHRELADLRKKLLATRAPTSQGSTSCKLATLGDPAGSEAIAPAYAWAAECWRSEGGDPKALRKDELKEAWAAARDQIGGWPTSRGVARRCWLTLEMIGWMMAAPPVFMDHQGAKVDLCRH